MNLNISVDFQICISVPLKRRLFEHNAEFAFCEVFRISVTYKIGLNNFDTIFLLYIPETSCLGVNYFIKNIFSKSFI